MHLRRYRRKSVLEALRAIREELGPDALVLSTRLVPIRGIRGWLGAREVEVTAASDRPAMSEIRQGAPAVRADPAAGTVAARLQAAGLDARLAQEIAAAHPARRRGISAQALEDTLAEQLAPLVADAAADVRVEAFVGPPGGGKTTTVAKIAARERACHGRRLGLVAADGFRVGAVEQLRLYADILGSRLTVARTTGELDDALARARGPLLVDTAGRSPADDASREMFQVLAGRRHVRTHLVLPAGTSPSDASRAFDRFEEAKPSRVVLTRLDEVESIGPLVRVLRDRRIPLSYFGTGQHVPDDLHEVTAAGLAAWVLGNARTEGARA